MGTTDVALKGTFPPCPCIISHGGGAVILKKGAIGNPSVLGGGVCRYVARIVKIQGLFHTVT